MDHVKKWPFITGIVATMVITILSCLFFSLSAAFYRGSLISNLESGALPASEILRVENEYAAVGNKTIIYIAMAAAILIGCILVLVLLNKNIKPVSLAYAGIVISICVIVQIVISINVLIFQMLSLPALALGIALLIFGLIKQKSISFNNSD